jgi:hypothetical protein
MQTQISEQHQLQLLEELRELDRQQIELDGKSFKASQCYHWESDPAHLLFNTNCPADLRDRVESIIAKYVTLNETSAS